MAQEFTPYSTGEKMFGQRPSWVSNSVEQQRLLSYLLYEQIYWNAPEIFKVSMRGSNDQPIYVPSGRTIVDTSNRYTAPAFAVNVMNAANASVDTTDVIAARIALSDFMARERFKSKFNGAKRYCQIQGDWVWHLTADPLKPVGTRLSLATLDPSRYFPQFDPDNVDRRIAVFLAELGTDPKGDERVRRICYRKVVGASGVVEITVEEGWFEADQWESLEATPETVVRAVTPLPPEITEIPVYHIKNFEEPGNTFGSSEMRGLEVLMASLNQTVSDEELTLALDGIGVYTTDAPRPIDPVTKQEVNWVLGPGRVLHRPPGTMFDRLTGVASVVPYGDHFNRVWNSMKESSASPDVAVGTVDVAIAQSGIALALQLSPILAKAGEKNDLILEAHNQMFFDLMTMWYPAYEETTFNEVKVACLVGDAVPVDREARFAELNDMLDRGVIDTSYYRSEAAKLGYVFPDNIGTLAKAEADAKRTVVDPFAGRLAAEDGGTGAPQ